MWFLGLKPLAYVNVLIGRAIASLATFMNPRAASKSEILFSVFSELISYTNSSNAFLVAS
jgi:hypothetical protein